MLEFLHSHTNVVFQPPITACGTAASTRMPPGFAMFQDIKRFVSRQRKKNKYWFLDIAGSDWLERCISRW